MPNWRSSTQLASAVPPTETHAPTAAKRRPEPLRDQSEESSSPSRGVGGGVGVSRRGVVVAVLAVASVGGWWLGEQRDDAAPRARVVEVLDGDTVVVAFTDGTTDTIRLLGVDTPNVAQHHLASFGPAIVTSRSLFANTLGFNFKAFPLRQFHFRANIENSRKRKVFAF